MNMRLLGKGRAWVLAGLFAVGSFARGETTGPAVLPETLGSVVIGDISGLLDRTGALAARVVPEMKPDQLKQQAGAMVGDPGLSALPPGSGLAVILPQDGKPFAYLEVSEEKRAQWRELFKQRGMEAVGEAEGLLIGAVDSRGLERAKELAPQVKSQLLAGRGEPTLEGGFKLAQILQKYESQIQAGLKGFSNRAAETGTTETAAQLQAAATMLQVYYALGGQVETLGVGLAPSAEALTMNYTVIPKNGAAGAQTVGANPSGAQLLELLPGRGAIRAEMTLDPQAMLDFTFLIMDEISKSMDGAAEDDKAFKEWVRNFGETWTGAAAMTFMPGKDAPMSGAYAIGVKDEAAAVEFLAETPAKFQGSSMARFYEQMGMSFDVAFEKNVRQYKEVPIHQLKTDVEFTTAATEQQRRMQKMLDDLTYDVAVVKNVLLYAVEPYKIEELIDAAKAGRNPAAKPLVSKGKLPPGGRGYFDYDIGQAMSAMTAMHASDDPGSRMMKSMAAAVKDSPPLLIGGYRAGDGYQLTVRAPAETLRAFIQAGKQSQAAVEGGTESDEKPTTAGAAGLR